MGHTRPRADTDGEGVSGGSQRETRLGAAPLEKGAPRLPCRAPQRSHAIFAKLAGGRAPWGQPPVVGGPHAWPAGADWLQREPRPEGECVRHRVPSRVARGPAGPARGDRAGRPATERAAQRKRDAGRTRGAGARGSGDSEGGVREAQPGIGVPEPGRRQAGWGVQSSALWEDAGHSSCCRLRHTEASASGGVGPRGRDHPPARRHRQAQRPLPQPDAAAH